MLCLSHTSVAYESIVEDKEMCQGFAATGWQTIEELRLDGLAWQAGGERFELGDECVGCCAPVEKRFVEELVSLRALARRA